MMKTVISLLVCSCTYFTIAQQDTLFMSQWQRADTIYGQLGQHVNTGFLLNRTLMDTTDAFVYNTDKTDQYIPRADYFYRLMQELKLMALDSSTIPDQYSLYTSASTFIGSYEFHEERYVYPMGIADFQYNWLDQNLGEQTGLLISDGGIGYLDADPLNGAAYSTYRASLIAPLFDYFVSDEISLVFKEQGFFSNYKTPGDVQQIEIYQDSLWTSVSFDQEYQLKLKNSATQEFTVRVTYTDGSQIENEMLINTPELELNDPTPKFYLCKETETFWVGASSLKYCMIPGCDNPTANAENPRPKKPYLLVAGYRPPIFGQSFKTTWRNYNTEHDNLLGGLNLNDYDVYLVKFNIHETPQGHGMLESAQLFAKLIEHINSEKIDPHNETVVQGSSMGCDIVRLALLQMEKKHFEDNSYPHHHCRLFINYDGNFFGANISLAYQYQIYSGFYQPESPPFLESIMNLLKTFLYATMQQKTVKELLTYHAHANQTQLFQGPVQQNDIVPATHQLRYEYYDALNAANTANPSNHIFPMPNSTRNVAISLGKIGGTNDVQPINDGFNAAGEYWRNDIIPGIQKIRTGIFTTGYTPFFHREKVLVNSVFGVPVIFGTVKHVINVKEMQEIDNASGSFLADFGNLNYITTLAYFGPDQQRYFTHKSVATALGINPDIWPTDGSMTLDMQNLGLMYDQLNFNPNSPSFHIGYPNLGRPNDHYDITPFEAIYVDKTIDPHIRLKDSPFKPELNGFIFNEVEPWYLGLQNDVVGSQARPNYIYRSKRQALYGVTVGELVTPKTDPGEFIVNPNADVIIQAGEYVDLFPGTTFTEGCTATVRISYDGCQGAKSSINNLSSSDRKTIRESNQRIDDHKVDQMRNEEIDVFPNPTSGYITIISLNREPFNKIEIYDFSGNLVFEKDGIHASRFEPQKKLQKGTYILNVTLNGQVHHKKLIVL